MNGGSIFFQHPIGLWGAEPSATAQRELGPYAEAVYWRVFEQIRKGRGTDTLDHIMTLFDDVRRRQDRERWQHKLRQMLQPRYNLFRVNSQRMVTIVDHSREIRYRNKLDLLGPSFFDLPGFERGS